METRKYFAFISYKREDEWWAKWLAHKLEDFKLPTSLNGKELPKNLRPVFRDIDELSAGNLPKQIYHALSVSKNLIVVCSPRSAQSKWVNKEINDFIAIKGGKSDNIFPFIIEGNPYSKDSKNECFPEILRNLHDNEERLGGNINEQGGRDAALVKIISGMLGVSFDSLWQKHEREQKKKRKWITIATIIAFLCISSVAFEMFWQNRQIKKANWKMMENRARFVAAKGEEIIKNGDSYLAKLLAINILPSDLNNIDRPYTVEAESMLRTAFLYNSAVLNGHTNNVTSASFSPDGKKIVSASWDKTIRIWDVETGKQIGVATENHTSFVSYATFSPDGKKIISASDDRTIRIWDAETGEQIGEPLEGHTDFINSASFSPDGKKIVSAADDRTIRIWDAETGEQIGEPLEGHTDIINSVSFNPDGKKIISASDDRTIRIWDAETGEQIGEPLEGHTDFINSASFSPDGKKFVSAADDRTIRIWNAETGEQIGEPLKGHTDFINSVSFSPDGKKIVSASKDETIRIWDVKTGKPMGKPLEGHTNNVTSVSFSPDGKKIVSASKDETIRIWDIKPKKPIGKLMEGHTNFINSVSFSTDGKKIASASKDSTIRIWNVETGKQIGEPL